MRSANSKYRRMLKRLPKDLTAALAGLTSPHIVEKYQPLYMGWSAEVRIGSHRFRVFAEAKRIFVSEMVDRKEELLSPAEDMDIYRSSRLVAMIINRRIA